MPPCGQREGSKPPALATSLVKPVGMGLTVSSDSPALNINQPPIACSTAGQEIGSFHIDATMHIEGVHRDDNHPADVRKKSTPSVFQPAWMPDNGPCGRCSWRERMIYAPKNAIVTTTNSGNKKTTA